MGRVPHIGRFVGPDILDGSAGFASPAPLLRRAQAFIIVSDDPAQ